MAKQYMSPLLRRLTSLRTEAATGRTRQELSWRKTEIARLERWTGRAKKTSVRRTPARHCACSALLASYTPAWRLPRQLLCHAQDKKLRGLGGTCQAQLSKTMQNHVMPRMQKSCQTSPAATCPDNARGRAKKTGRKKRMASWERQRQHITKGRGQGLLPQVPGHAPCSSGAGGAAGGTWGRATSAGLAAGEQAATGTT